MGIWCKKQGACRPFAVCIKKRLHKRRLPLSRPGEDPALEVPDLPPYERLWHNRCRREVLLAPEPSQSLGACACTGYCKLESCLNAVMLVECGPHCCGVEEAECENRQFSRAQLGDYEDLAEIFWTGPLKGFGLRARRTIPNGHFVAEYVGDIVSQERISNWQYVMSLPTGLAIDASKAGGPARFINHSCEPNSVAQRWQVAGRYRVGIFAARDIQAEEEITFSYSNLRGQSSSSDACHCGSLLCSGRIWQPPRKAPKKTAEAKAAATASCKPAKKRRQRGGTRDQAPPGKSKASEAAEVENVTEAGQVEDCNREAMSRTVEDAKQAQVGVPVVGKTVEAHWEQHDWELSEKFCESFFSKAGWQHSPKEARQMLEQQQLPCSRELAAASTLGLYLPTALLSARESPLCR